MAVVEYPASLRPGMNTEGTFLHVVPTGTLDAISTRDLGSYVELPHGIEDVYVYFDLPDAALEAQATAIDLVALTRFSGDVKPSPALNIRNDDGLTQPIASAFSDTPIEASTALDVTMWPYVFAPFTGGAEPAAPTKTAYHPRFQAPASGDWVGSTLWVYYLALRITYGDAESYRRVYPRDDRRNWPPPKAYSRGNRRGGGYL